MIDFGFDKLALIGVVALVVIGPEKLPRVARTVGNLVGRAQRYMADVKAEVNRTMDLEELKKMKSDVEQAASSAQQQWRSEVQGAERSWQDAMQGTGPALPAEEADTLVGHKYEWDPDETAVNYMTTQNAQYTPRKPQKSWRARRTAVPAWFKQRHHLRSQAQNAAARVARFRPANKSMRG